MNQQPETRKIRVLRPFFFKKKTLKVKTVLEVSAEFAAEMVTSNKAEYADTGAAEVAIDPVDGGKKAKSEK